jgi:mannitol/fructose-specific phosphotransferase system IIA component (Ntr-type)
MCNTLSPNSADNDLRCDDCGNRLPGDNAVSASTLCPSCDAWNQLLRALVDAEPQILASDAILPNLMAETKRKAIYEIVQHLARCGHLDVTEIDAVTASLLRREELASTGVGHGIAIPHTTHTAVTRAVVAVARSRSGIDFDSLDGKPVRVIALALCPAEQPGEQLRVIATIARHLREFDNQTQWFPTG